MVCRNYGEIRCVSEGEKCGAGEAVLQAPILGLDLGEPSKGL